MQSEKRRSITEITIISLVITITYVGLLIYKGVYPFGNNAFILVSDGYQQNLPVIYYMWDVLHGNRNLFYDYGIAFGSNMAGMLSHFGMLSPINLIYIFVPREYIIQSTIWTTLLRLLLAGYSVRFFLKTVFKNKLNMALTIILSFSYCFSSWLIRYLAFFQWIDVAIVLPVCLALLIMLFEQIREDENKPEEHTKKAGMFYTISLALILILNIQQSFAILIFLIIFSGFYLFINGFKINHIKKCIFALGFYTIIAMLLSAVFLLPAVYQVTHSARIDQGNIIYKIKQIIRSCKSPDKTFVTEKNIIFSSCYIYIIFSLYLGIRCLFIKNKDKIKNNVLRFIGIVVLSLIIVLPVFVESVGYIWQGGEYVCFPLRAGEIIAITLIYMTGYLAVCVTEDLQIIKGLEINISSLLLGVLTVVSIIYFAGNLVTVGDFVNNEDMYGYQQELSALDNSADIRYKNTDFTSNVSVVSGLSMGSNYLHLMTAEAISTNSNLGYRQNWTRISDNGGTAFSDGVLGYRYYLSKEDSILARPVLKVLPFGLYIDNDGNNISDLAESECAFDGQNYLAKAIMGKEIFTIDCYEMDGQEDFTIEYVPDVSGSELCLVFDNLDFSDSIIVSIQDKEYYCFDGINNIGNIDEPVNIIINSSYNGKVYVGEYDANTYLSYNPEDYVDNLNIENASISFEVINDQSNERLLFIPVNYEEGWNVYLINSSNDCKYKAKFVRCCGSFIGITIPADYCGRVIMKYRPPYLFAGALLTIVALLILIIDRFADIKKILSGIFAENFTLFVYGSVFAGIICFMILLLLLTLIYNLF